METKRFFNGAVQGREGGRKGGRGQLGRDSYVDTFQFGLDLGWEGRREGGREGGREEWRARRRKEGREGGREGETHLLQYIRVTCNLIYGSTDGAGGRITARKEYIKDILHDCFVAQPPLPLSFLLCFQVHVQ
jgi:hypothetical protein